MKKYNTLEETSTVSAFPGHYRRTLTGDENIMMCMFNMEAGTLVKLHNHPAAQIGIILKGEMEFFDKDGNVRRGGPGFSYCFDPEEMHGCKAISDCEFMECFTPSRSEYDN